MGLLFSNCKSCGKEISWFPWPPSDLPCKNCGTIMTTDEHLESQHEHYKRHIASIIKEKFSSLPIEELSSKLALRKEFLEEVLEYIRLETRN